MRLRPVNYCGHSKLQFEIASPSRMSFYFSLASPCRYLGSPIFHTLRAWAVGCCRLRRLRPAITSASEWPDALYYSYDIPSSGTPRFDAWSIIIRICRRAAVVQEGLRFRLFTPSRASTPIYPPLSSIPGNISQDDVKIRLRLHGELGTRPHFRWCG